jgi:alkylation response protein AidB-like acyl-CoA dehydrogenase
MTHLNAEGDERIKQDYLVPSISGDKIGFVYYRTFEVVMLQECAPLQKKGDKYIINGSKTFITNGVYGDYYVVGKKTSPELGNKG